MIRKPFDGDVPPIDPDDAFDDADVRLRRVEDSSLLDVELDVRSNVALPALHRVELRRVATDEIDPCSDGLAASAHERELLCVQLAAHRATANEAAFLVLKDHDLEGVARDDLVLAQCRRHLDCSHGPHVAVVVAAFGHRIDVRAKEDGFAQGVAPRAAANQIAGCIDVRVQTGVAQEGENPLARLPVGVGVGESRDAALRVAPVLGERGKRVVEPRAVDAKGCGREQAIEAGKLTRPEGREARRGKEREHVAAVDGVMGHRTVEGGIVRIGGHLCCTCSLLLREVTAEFR